MGQGLAGMQSGNRSPFVGSGSWNRGKSSPTNHDTNTSAAVFLSLFPKWPSGPLTRSVSRDPGAPTFLSLSPRGPKGERKNIKTSALSHEGERVSPETPSGRGRLVGTGEGSLAPARLRKKPDSQSQVPNLKAP